MKILMLNIDPNQGEFNYRLARELMKRGHEIFSVTLSGGYAEFMRKKGIRVFNIEQEVIKMTKKFKDKKNKEIFLKVRKTISEEEIKDLYESETFLISRPKEFFEKKVIFYIHWWNKVLEKEKPDLIFTVDGGEMLHNVCKYVCNKKKITILWTCGLGPLAGTIYWDVTNMYTSWINEEYLNVKPTRGENKKIEDYLASLKEKKLIHGGKPKKIVTSSKILKYPKFCYNWVVKEKCQDYHNPFTPIKIRLSQIKNKRLFRRYYSEPKENEKYVFFPLHDPDDAQITVRARKFANQAKIVKKCASLLPEGILLYVKEHPHVAGKIPFAWIKELSKVKNIRILDPMMNAHDLIKKAECVITIASSAGWETLLYEKPLVVLAHPFYSHKGITFDVDKESELKKKIFEAIKKKKFDKRMIEKRNRLINAIFHSLYDCAYYSLATGVLKSNPEQQNIKRIAESILDKYSKVKCSKK